MPNWTSWRQPWEAGDNICRFWSSAWCYAEGLMARRKELGGGSGEKREWREAGVEQKECFEKAIVAIRP